MIIIPDTETATILGMETVWFSIILVTLILSVAGLVTAGMLCFCRQRATTPRHSHNAHNAQTHPPVTFPCELEKNRSLEITNRRRGVWIFQNSFLPRPCRRHIYSIHGRKLLSRIDYFLNHIGNFPDGQPLSS